MNNRTSSQAMLLRAALIALLLAAFALRLTSLDLQDIWWDEARNLDVALRPLTEIATAPELDIQPPLYYYLLHGWLKANRVGMGDIPATLAWFSRFVSVFFGVLLVALSGQLARRIGGRFALFAAVAIGAFSPFWLAESQETRMYTVVLTLLTAAALALLKAQAIDDKSLTSLPTSSTSTRAASPTDISATEHRLPTANYRLFLQYALFVLFSALAFLVHYNAVFVLVAWYVWWLGGALLRRGGWEARWNALKPLLLCGIVTVLLVLPVAPIALRQIPGYGNANLVVPNPIDYLMQNLHGHIAGYTWALVDETGWSSLWFWSILGATAVGLIMLTVRRNGQQGFLRDFSFLLIWFAGGLLLYYVAVLDRGAFNIRYSAMVTPALVALLGAAAAGWNLHRHAPLGWLFLLLLTPGLLLFARTDLTHPQFFREDIQGVTDWLRNNTRAGDLILVDQKYPFGFYYDRYAVDEAATPEGSEVAPARYLFVDINTLADRLTAWASDSGRVFWVQWFESDTDPRHAVPFLLDQNGTHAGEQWFQGWSIDWWQMEPPNNYALGEGLTPLAVRFAQSDGAPAVETVEVSFPATIIDDDLPVVLRWKRSPGSGAIRPLKARVALYDSGDNRIAQADERLLNDRHLAPGEWQEGDAPLNLYLPTPDAPLAPGIYQVRLLVYDADTLEALTVLDKAGIPAGIEATFGEVTVE